jgi:hypothetical protein
MMYWLLVARAPRGALWRASTANASVTGTPARRSRRRELVNGGFVDDEQVDVAPVIGAVASQAAEQGGAEHCRGRRGDWRSRRPASGPDAGETRGRRPGTHGGHGTNHCLARGAGATR